MTSKMVAKYLNMIRTVVFSLLLALPIVTARKHHLKLEIDKRPVITMSSFGFLKNGVLFVNVTDLTVVDAKQISNQTVGFTLGVSKSSGAEGFMEEYPDKCVMRKDIDQGRTDEDVKSQAFSLVFFRLDFQKRSVEIERKGKALENLIIVNGTNVEQYRYPEVPKIDTSASRRKRAIGDPLPKRGSQDSQNPAGSINVTKTPAVTVETTTETTVAKTTLKPAVTVPKSAGGANAEPPPKAGIQDKNTDAGKENEENDKEPDNKEKSQEVAQPGILTEFFMTRKEPDSFSFSFLVAVTRTEEEGMYNLNFHNCIPDTDSGQNEISLTLDIIEDNDGNYLSAGKMPLPTLYFVLSFTYLVVAIIWNTVLCKSEDAVYKMHYLMLVVVFVKSLSCLFHAVNFHFIRKEGIHEEAWAVLYYIAYLTRGALLFVTIILIGSGWAFIKHVLSDREKKLFLIFIPLQILDNIASIIVEESEEGQSQYTVWKEIFILIDLLCCGAILFPVVWSIKHLQEASRANGKEMFSLTKLKLFRQFYIMVVCYIYFTRIIVYLLKLTVPFKYEWLDELFKELATIMFFVITGYKFRPATDNPYLQVPSDDEEEDLEMDTVIVGESEHLDSVKKVNQGGKEESTSLKLRESSHEYD